MKRGFFLFLPFLFTAFVVVFLLWFKSESAPVSQDSTSKDFLITRGSSASQIGNKLQKEGLVKSPLAFKIYVQITGKAKKIQAGEYRLLGSYNLFRLVDELTRGPIEIWVTVPEGLRKEEIADRFAESLSRNEEFKEEFLIASAGLEGFLFPDTYIFPKTATASAIVAKMKKTFDQKVDGKMREDIQKGELNLSEVVILASIVERETKFDQERPIIAGILLNRLRIGMGLQADATVQYAVGKEGNWWPSLTKEDLEIKSAFNTYKYKGLPPSPIANPGASSIKAAIYPQDVDFLYYIHDSEGRAHYARDLEEHNENIRKYLR